MLQIEILSSPDHSVINQFQFFHNELYLGHSAGNLRISDPELLASHLMIEVVESDLIVHPQSGVTSYLIDGKRASTIRKIKTGQVLTIGKTSLKILNYSFTEFKTKKNVLDAKLANLIETNSPKLAVIEKLAGLMK